MTGQLPRVIKFAEIEKGDTIEQTTPDGSKVTIAATDLSPDGTVWYSPDGDQGAQDEDGVTLRLLDRPVPALPTAPGTVIRIGDNVWLLDDNGDWFEALTNVPPSPEDATDWTVIYDPTAPKADDGLRDRVEGLATEWQNDFGPAPSFARELRDVLAKTGADQ